MFIPSGHEIRCCCCVLTPICDLLLALSCVLICNIVEDWDHLAAVLNDRGNERNVLKSVLDSLVSLLLLLLLPLASENNTLSVKSPVLDERMRSGH